MSRTTYRDACTLALFRYGTQQISIVIVDDLTYEVHETKGAVTLATAHATEYRALDHFKASVIEALS